MKWYHCFSHFVHLPERDADRQLQVWRHIRREFGFNYFSYFQDGNVCPLLPRSFSRRFLHRKVPVSCCTFQGTRSLECRNSIKPRNQKRLRNINLASYSRILTWNPSSSWYRCVVKHLTYSRLNLCLLLIFVLLRPWVE